MRTQGLTLPITKLAVFEYIQEAKPTPDELKHAFCHVIARPSKGVVIYRPKHEELLQARIKRLKKMGVISYNTPLGRWTPLTASMT